ncbi:MAG: 16S rRNA (adenine(1518)-N(6)/adenine(1519)-N(6))-dimethyltransferase RsmA [Fibrobacteraceae bacterium]|nr:16S rRNA (adenine(1518)-N(6)/adenine(1519)-N(6))-dimethyltransferase RsmA [Fibrobacteraceae bacterium]
MDRARRRKFGQNFLDDNTAKLIAEDLEATNETPILEIGPGHGAMTIHLLQKGAPLTAIEIDEQCVEILKKKFEKNPLFEIENIDFLKFDLDLWLKNHNTPWITGNLPYNVSTGIISSILPKLHKTLGFMGMVQLEVAERLCAKPGSSAYGSLSVYLSSFANAKILRKIGPEHFTPKPNVDSATVLITPKSKPLDYPEGFFDFVRLSFSQKRKRLANSLASSYSKQKVFECLSSLSLSENTRAEELSPETFLELFLRLK